MNVFNDIRSKIHMMNTKLTTYKAPVEESTLTQGVQHTDKTMLKHCQEKNASLQFVASLNAFSFHWETMTIPQQKKYLNDYIESEYAECTCDKKSAIQDFLEKEIIEKKNGNRRVKWNGYFIENLPELTIQEQTGDKHNKEDITSSFVVKFKPTQNDNTENTKKVKQEKKNTQRKRKNSSTQKKLNRDWGAVAYVYSYV